MHYTKFRSGLLAGVAIAGAAITTPALAQSSDAGAADIIVTARRTEERLQDVPISITVLNQQQLTQRNIAIATDLATYTPSLSVNQRFGPEKASYSLRGFNQDANTAPTVGVYFAEVVGVRAQGGTTSGNTVGAGAFVDLQNVQVLKGPQGTLFGRNTTGGAILLTPAKPTDTLGGYVEGTYGNYDQKKISGAINVPLAETFKVRFSYERNKRDGFMHNLSGIGPKDYNNINYSYYRFSMVANLTPTLENYTVAQYSDSHANGYATRIIGCASPTSSTPLNTVRGTPGFSGTRLLQALSCQDQLNRQNARGDSLYDVETRNPGGSVKLKQWQVINTTTWLASDLFTVKNIASYGEFTEQSNFDLGTSNFTVPNVNGSGGFDLRNISPQLPFTIPAGVPYQRIVLDTAGPGHYNSAQATATEELQIQGHTQTLDFVVGGYLEFSRPLGFSDGRTAIFLDCSSPRNLACTNPLFFGSISESSTKLKFDNHGVFAQATYKFTDQLSLTGGARYTFDKITGFTNSTRLSFAANAGTGPLFTDPVSGRMVARACTDSFRHGPQTGARPALDRSVCTTNLTNKSNKPTWLADIDYKPTNDLLFYGKYSRGYRQGGISFTNPGVETWGPESLDAFELGAKASFRGTFSGYLNVAAFYNKLRDLQVFAGLISSPAGAAVGVAGGNAVINAGAGRSYGVEVDASASYERLLRLDVGYTYLNTKVTQVAAAATAGDGSALGNSLLGTPFGSINPTVQVGSPFTFAPKHKLTVTGTFTLPVAESVGEISISGTYVHSSSYVNDGALTTPAYVNGIGLGTSEPSDIVNANVDWRNIAGSPFDLAFFVTNLTKERYTVANGSSWGSAGVGDILLNQPRFYGVRARFHFGQ